MNNTTIIKNRFSFKRYLANWAIIALLLIVGAIVGLGWDSLDESVDVFTGFETLTTLFGGIFSFWAIVVLLLIVAAVAFAIFKMCKTDFTDHNGRLIGCIIGGLVVIIIAMVIGTSWIHLPSGTGLMALGGFLVPTLLAFRHSKVAKLETLDEETETSTTEE